MKTPNDFAVALEKVKLGKFFAGCAPAHQREYLKWIGEAKRPETRKERIGKAVKMLAARSTRKPAREKKSS